MVKPGYQQTEIGVLPETWDTIPFEKCFSMLPNNTLARSDLNYTGGRLRNIHYGDILVKYPSVLDCTKEGLPYVNAEHAAKVSKGFLQDGDIIIADTAEDATVGKAIEVMGIGDTKVVSGLHTIPCRPKNPDLFVPKWLGYFVNHSIFHDQLIPFITGTKVSSISRSAISGTFIAVPSKPEQHAIVSALSDIDAFIAKLETLISKKNAMKQGAMQELLTGKRRLSGFHDEWKERFLEEVADMFSGGTPDSKNESYYGGSIPWVSISDISESGKYITATEKSLTKAGLENSSARVYPPNTLLFAMYASIGKCCIARSRVASSQAILGLYNFRDVDLDFLYYYLQYKRQSFIEMGQTGTQSNLSKQIVQKIALSLPSLEEQQTIATILSDLDSEIEMLEKKLSKINHIKSGMMSELLTGRIRLTGKEEP